MKEQNDSNQIMMFQPGGTLVTLDTQRAFAAKDVLSKGVKVGTSVGLLPRKELAAIFELKGKDHKDELDAKILEVRDNMMTNVRGDIARLNGDWTYAKATLRTLASGHRKLTIALEEVKRTRKQVDEEKYAAAFGLTVEELRSKLAEHEAAQAAKNADVPSTTVSTEPASA